MDRRARIVEPIGPLTGRGLEIGALEHPIVERGDAEVLYVDHADTDELREKYAGDENVGAIVEVDVVWGDSPLAAALGPRVPVDWVVASHVIEHVPNPIGWLDELASVMRDGAVLSLAIPDKRYCFDIHRRQTNAADIVGAWLAGSHRPNPAAVYEFYACLADVDASQAWAGAYTVEPFDEDVERGIEWARRSAATDAYFDVHCWTFTPRSFLEILRTLFRAGLTSFRVAAFTETLPNELEFMCALERLPRTLDGDAARDERRTLQLASLPALGQRGPGPGPGTSVMVLSDREVSLVEAKRRAAAAVRTLARRVARGRS